MSVLVFGCPHSNSKCDEAHNPPGESSPLPNGLHLLRRRNSHNAMIVPIEIKRQVFYLAVFLNPHGEGSVCALSFYAQGQKAFDVGTAIRRVVILIMLFVPEHVDPVEVWLVQLVRFV